MSDQSSKKNSKPQQPAQPTRPADPGSTLVPETMEAILKAAKARALFIAENPQEACDEGWIATVLGILDDSAHKEQAAQRMEALTAQAMQLVPVMKQAFAMSGMPTVHPSPDDSGEGGGKN